MVRAKWQPTEEDAESIQAIARNVRAFRQKSLLTMTDFSNKTGIRRSTLYALESGRLFKIPYWMVNQIAEAFQVESSIFFEKPAKDGLAKIFDEIKKLDPESKRLLIAAIKSL